MTVSSTEFDVKNVFEWDDEKILSVNVRCDFCRSTLMLTQRLELRGEDRHMILFVEPHECHTVRKTHKRNPNIICVEYNEGSGEHNNGWREMYKCKNCANSFGGLVDHECTQPCLIL